MELEQFIEQDIVNFLKRSPEEKQAPLRETPRKDGILTPEELAVAAPGKDYSKALEEAIHENDFPRAQRLIIEFKERISGYPEESPELLEGNRLLKSLYDQYRAALKDRPAMQEQLLETELPGLGPPPVRQPAVPAAAASDTGDAASAPMSPSSESPSSERVPAQPGPPGMSEEEEQALIADLQQVEALSKEGHHAAAMELYHKVRKGLSPEQLTPRQRERILPRLAELYEQLHRFLEHAPQGPEPEEAPNKGTTKGEREQKGLARRFRHHLDATRQAIEATELAEAMVQYNALHELYPRLPPKEQQVAQPVLRDLHQRIVSARKGSPASKSEGSAMLEEEERRLHGAP